MRIVIANDHVALELKKAMVDHLRELGHEVDDLGTDSTQSTDYPLWGEAAARKVASGDADFGIVLCGTGQGIGITANKVPGVRCVICSDPYSARMGREHNDANMISLGARVVGLDVALEIVDVFLTSDFLGERHARRVAQIAELDAGKQLNRNP